MSESDEGKKRKALALARGKRNDLTQQVFDNLDGDTVIVTGDQLQGGTKMTFAQLKYMYENIYKDEKIPEYLVFDVMQKGCDALLDYTEEIETKKQVKCCVDILFLYYDEVTQEDEDEDNNYDSDEEPQPKVIEWDGRIYDHVVGRMLSGWENIKGVDAAKFSQEAINQNLTKPIKAMAECIIKYYGTKDWEIHEDIIDVLLNVRQGEKLVEPRYEDQNIQAMDAPDSVVVYEELKKKGDAHKRAKVK